MPVSVPNFDPVDQCLHHLYLSRPIPWKVRSEPNDGTLNILWTEEYFDDISLPVAVLGKHFPPQRTKGSVNAIPHMQSMLHLPSVDNYRLYGRLHRLRVRR